MVSLPNGVKVMVQITLDDLGRLNVISTSQNLVTTLGMIELSKKIIAETQRAEEPSRIERV